MLLIRVAGLVIGGALALALLALTLVLGVSEAYPELGGKTLSALASGPGMMVTIAGARFERPFGITLSDITIADDAGTWLKADRAAVQGNPWKFIRGDIALESVTIGAAEIPRRPETRSGGGASPAIHIGTLDIGSLAFEQLPPIRAAGSGIAWTPTEKASTLHLRRADGEAGHADIEASYTDTLDLKASIDDPTGLAADRLLGRNDHASLSLDIAGSGALEHWRGRIRGAVGALMRLDTGMLLSREDGRLVLEAEGEGGAPGLLPPSVRQQVGDDIPFRIRVSRDESGLILAERLDLSLAAGEIAARLTYDPGRALLGGDAGLTLPDWGRFELDAAIRRQEDGTLLVDNLDLSGKTGRLTGARLDGTGRFSSGGEGAVTAKMKLLLPDLKPLAPEMSGSAELTATAEGTLRMLEARFQGALRTGALDATASAAVRLKERRFLSVPEFRLGARDTVVAGHFDADLAERRVTGAATGHAAELAPWSDLAGRKLGGGIDLDIRLDSRERAEAMLDGRRLVFGEGLGAETISARLHLLHPASSPTGDARITVTRASLPGGAIDKAELTAASLSGGNFRFATRLEGRLREAATLSASGEGKLAQDRQTLSLLRLSGRYADVPVTLERPLRLERRAQAYSFDGLALAFGAGRFLGKGAIERGHGTLHLEAKSLPLGLYAKLAGRPGYSGEGGATLDASGTPDAPEGRIVLEAWNLHIGHIGGNGSAKLPALSVVASAELRKGMLSARGRIAGAKETAVGFSGTAPVAIKGASPLPPEGKIAARLEGEGELAQLQELMPLGENQIAGTYRIDLTLAGTVGAPRASGTLSLSRGRFENLAAGIRLRDLTLDLAGNNERLDIRRLTADDGSGGGLRAEGGVDLAATGAPLALTAELQHFIILGRDDAHGTATGRISLAGTVAEPQIKGKLTVDRAEIQLPDRLPPRIAALKVIRIDRNGNVVQPEAPAEEGMTAAAVALALDIDLPGRIFVRGHGLDSEWRGHVALGGALNAPVLTGTLETVRGSYDFVGTTFTLAKGHVTFTGGRKIDPAIDIVAQNTNSGIAAEIRITGSVSDPTIKLDSTPPLPQDEILARVLFGQSLGQLTPAQGLQIAQLAASLATGGGPGVLDTIRKGLGLDVLSFGKANTLSNINPGATAPGLPMAGSATSQTQGATSGGLGGSTLSAGKYVAPGVYVGVTQGLSAGSSAATVQFELTPNLNLKTEFGTGETGSGLGLDWKYDY